MQSRLVRTGDALRGQRKKFHVPNRYYFKVRKNSQFVEALGYPACKNLVVFILPKWPLSEITIRFSAALITPSSTSTAKRNGSVNSIGFRPSKESSSDPAERWRRGRRFRTIT